MAEKPKKDEAQRHGEPPVWEWIIAAVGLILVTGAIAFLLYQAATQTKHPPNFVIKVNSIAPSGDGYLVRFELENTGDETAAAVLVEGELTRNAESIEKKSATLTYAPSHSKRQFFTKNPSEFELKIRVVGYEKT